jgi:hypothetical protein
MKKTRFCDDIADVADIGLTRGLGNWQIEVRKKRFCPRIAGNSEIRSNAGGKMMRR